MKREKEKCVVPQATGVALSWNWGKKVGGWWWWFGCLGRLPSFSHWKILKGTSLFFVNSVFCFFLVAIGVSRWAASVSPPFVLVPHWTHRQKGELLLFFFFLVPKPFIIISTNFLWWGRSSFFFLGCCVLSVCVTCWWDFFFLNFFFPFGVVYCVVRRDRIPPSASFSVLKNNNKIKIYKRKKKNLLWISGWTFHRTCFFYFFWNFVLNSFIFLFDPNIF